MGKVFWRVYLAPVLLGNGVRFFNRSGAPDAVHLETVDVAQFGQLADLHYRVIK